MVKESIVLKPPTSFEQQIELYKSRGLVIDDIDSAVSFLKSCNYYRLRGYTLSLMNDDKFHKGTTFEHLKNIYEFDTKLRILLMTIIEQIEIAFRTHIAYLIAHQYGPLGYRDSRYFENEDFHFEFITILDNLILNSKELFINHHKNIYGSQFPIWVAVEIITFSSLSKLFNNLKKNDKKNIASTYYSNIPFGQIENWLHSLSIIRNTCAHYSRVYNKRLTKRTKMLKEDLSHNINTNELFSVLYNIKYLITNKSYWINWVTNLESLIDEYNGIDIKLLGFPENWKEIIY